MGKRYNPENFVDRVYMDSKFAETVAEMLHEAGKADHEKAS